MKKKKKEITEETVDEATGEILEETNLSKKNLFMKLVLN